MLKVWRAIVKCVRIMGEITIEAINEVGYFLAVNFKYMAMLLQFAVPYIMYVLGQQLVTIRGYMGYGGEIFVPVVLFIIIGYMKEVSNRMRKGRRVPVPEERFTDVSSDGEVRVDEDRLQEMILYMADLEDWMERKGWL